MDGICYQYLNLETRQNETREVFFLSPHAEIPVLAYDDSILLYQWGRRTKEEDAEYSVPVTGWARLDKIEMGFWKNFRPTDVLIPATKFCEKDALGNSRWFDLPKDTYLRGLKIQSQGKNFVYILTNPAIGELEKIHPRMPLVVKSDFSPADFDIEEAAEPEQQKLF